MKKPNSDLISTYHIGWVLFLKILIFLHIFVNFHCFFLIKLLFSIISRGLYNIGPFSVSSIWGSATGLQ